MSERYPENPDAAGASNKEFVLFQAAAKRLYESCLALTSDDKYPHPVSANDDPREVILSPLNIDPEITSIDIEVFPEKTEYYGSFILASIELSQLVYDADDEDEAEYDYDEEEPKNDELVKKPDVFILYKTFDIQWSDGGFIVYKYHEFDLSFNFDYDSDEIREPEKYDYEPQEASLEEIDKLFDAINDAI